MVLKSIGRSDALGHGDAVRLIVIDKEDISCLALATFRWRLLELD